MLQTTSNVAIIKDTNSYKPANQVEVDEVLTTPKSSCLKRLRTNKWRMPVDIARLILEFIRSEPFSIWTPFHDDLISVCSHATSII